ncbi:Flagellar biosynthetic protein FliP [Buchnera aphidicola (Myzocallis carpini)]
MFTIIPLLLILLFYSPIIYALEFSDINFHILYNSVQLLPASMKIFFFFALFSIIMTLILMTTGFIRIIIVLNLLRNALGISYAPPNQILLGISFLLTFFVMSPTVDQIYREAYLPFQHNNIQIEECIRNSINPIRNFMVHQTYEADLKTFFILSNTPFCKTKNVIPMKILLLSFITSELKTAFQIGFTIFIPFLIIDLIVASILISLGMIMVSPTNISLPIKLILFVLVDGWKLIFSSLIKSFH